MDRRDKILIAEDETNWQERISEFLTDEKWDLYIAGDLQSALQWTRKVRFQVKVIDICLSQDSENKDGMQVLEDNTKRNEGTVPLVLSGHGTIGLSVEAAKKHDILDFIEKNRFDAVRFMELVQDSVTLARQGIAQIPQDSEIWQLISQPKSLPKPMQVGMNVVDKNSAVEVSKLLPFGEIADDLELYQRGAQGWEKERDKSQRQLQRLFVPFLTRLGPAKFNPGNMTLDRTEAGAPMLRIPFWSREYGQAVSVIVAKNGVSRDLQDEIEEGQIIDTIQVGELEGSVYLNPDLPFEQFQS